MRSLYSSARHRAASSIKFLDFLSTASTAEFDSATVDDLVAAELDVAEPVCRGIMADEEDTTTDKSPGPLLAVALGFGCIGLEAPAGESAHDIQ